MNRSWHMVRAAVAALSLVMAPAVWSADEPSSTYPPASGDIIGYQPISNEALGAVVAAQPAATSAYAGSVTASPATAMPPPGTPVPSQLPPAYLTGILGDGPYTLGRDDVIHIDVRNQPEFTGDFAVGFDGRIQYNYLGDIPIAGMTKYEVQQVLEKLLQQYIRVPVVSVTITAYNSKVVYVIGEVGRPGKYIMRGDVIKLREAILAAGLPTPIAALGRVHVIKPDLNNPRVRKVNLKKILYKGKLKDDIDLFPGEIVVVPSTFMSGVNRFLSSLLSPATRIASTAALAAL
ncbi:MAG: polysaccharide biosynthesis/export family protein [Candidatus Omnitrophota bacterium]|nr:polysaccharide biosynthesis/export family protein [Candidatus Omnitrophota bacterium]